MIEYKYQKVKGLSEKKFLENGHTMFETDVLQLLKRLAHLEEQIKQGQLLPIDSVIVPKGTFCLSCEKEPATHGIGETKTVCGKCWNKIIA